MTLTIRDLPLGDRPRERLRQLGAAALSDQELLACVLGRGIAGESVLVTAQRLLQRFQSVRGIADASPEELAQVHGVGSAKATQLIAACALARRVEQDKACATEAVTDMAAACRVVEPLLRDQSTEQVVVVLLDAKYRALRSVCIARGSLTASLVHPREVFHEAIRARAAAVLVAHNHPSGDPTPSEEDVQLTEQLMAAGQLLGIPVLDHLIIGREHTVSLAQEGYLA